MCGRQGDVVGRHDRAGGPGLVARQPANVLAFGLGEVGEHDIDELLVEPVDQVGPFVVRHVVQQLGRLLGRHGLDDPVLALGAEVAQDLGAVARQQDPEQGVAVLGLQVLDQLGGPPRVLVLDEFAQGGDFAALDQLAQVGHQERVSHQPTSLSQSSSGDRSMGRPTRLRGRPLCLSGRDGAGVTPSSG